jgi:hypothetical protein
MRVSLLHSHRHRSDLGFSDSQPLWPKMMSWTIKRRYHADSFGGDQNLIEASLSKFNVNLPLVLAIAPGSEPFGDGV